MTAPRCSGERAAKRQRAQARQPPDSSMAANILYEFIDRREAMMIFQTSESGANVDETLSIYLNAAHIYRITCVPSAGSKTFHWQARSFFSLNCRSVAIILLAMSSKLLVASARIVGPAPDKHTPRNPGCVLGDIDCTTSVRPGMRVWRYGW